jgi:hypothetical protein
LRGNNSFHSSSNSFKERRAQLESNENENFVSPFLSSLRKMIKKVNVVSNLLSIYQKQVLKQQPKRGEGSKREG